MDYKSKREKKETSEYIISHLLAYIIMYSSVSDASTGHQLILLTQPILIFRARAFK